MFPLANGDLELPFGTGTTFTGSLPSGRVLLMRRRNHARGAIRSSKDPKNARFKENAVKQQAGVLQPPPQHGNGAAIKKGVSIRPEWHDQ
jgi:hypothetical protein